MIFSEETATFILRVGALRGSDVSEELASSGKKCDNRGRRFIPKRWYFSTKLHGFTSRKTDDK
jgi:hypothetical protein